MDRTVRVLLKATPEQGDVLTETMRQFTAAFNAVSTYGWEHRERNGVRLHHRTYRSLKAQLPALVSDLHIQARVKATEAVSSALTLLKKGRRVSAPRSPMCPPRYNVHTFTLDWEARDVRMSTTAGRMTIPFQVPAYAEKYAGGKVATADLIFRNDRWWLHVVVSLPAPEVTPTSTVVGVDLGLARPAVTSTARFLGQRHWREVEAGYFRLRRALQSRGTKSAKRHLRRLRGRQGRFRRDCDHVLSKNVIAAVPPGGTIALENLKDIRSRVRVKHGPQARRIHSWSFAQLRSFIVYKAEERGCTVAGVDPRHTSQQCSRCGHIARNNRRSRARFKCRACGFELQADLNGARNVAAKCLAGTGISGPGGLPVNQAIVSADTHVSSRHKLLALARRS